MILLSIGVLIVSVIVHEVAHGYVADRFGDPTAKLSGRLSLNPLVHIDPVGSVLIPLLLIATHSPVLLGWAKPVPINFALLTNGRRGIRWVALAGPLSNVTIIGISWALLNICRHAVFARYGVEGGRLFLQAAVLGYVRMAENLGSGFFPWIMFPVITFLSTAITINLILAVFNLIPIPPLDGSRVMASVLPEQTAQIVHRVEPYGILIIFILLYFDVFSFVYRWIIGPAVIRLVGI